MERTTYERLSSIVSTPYRPRRKHHHEAIFMQPCKPDLTQKSLRSYRLNLRGYEQPHRMFYVVTDRHGDVSDMSPARQCDQQTRLLVATTVDTCQTLFTALESDSSAVNANGCSRGLLNRAVLRDHLALLGHGAGDSSSSTAPLTGDLDSSSRSGWPAAAEVTGHRALIVCLRVAFGMPNASASIPLYQTCNADRERERERGKMQLTGYISSLRGGGYGARSTAWNATFTGHTHHPRFFVIPALPVQQHIRITQVMPPALEEARRCRASRGHNIVESDAQLLQTGCIWRAFGDPASSSTGKRTG